MKETRKNEKKKEKKTEQSGKLKRKNNKNYAPD
jgi:hypothetical protein